MHIKFVDISRQNSSLNKKYIDAFNKIIRNSDFIMGENIDKFEKKFASFCKKKFVITLNSGTDALKLSLLAYNVGGGDEVITVPNTYFSTAMVISEIGAKPVFVDINSNTYTIDTSKIEEKITKKTKAIIPVHLYGHPADMLPIMKIAKKYNLSVIEDACQAHGARYKNKILPYGETGAFSFYPGKNLGCFGDGGAVVTDNKLIAEKLQYLRNDGSSTKYVHKMFGYKSRMDSIQAAILNIKLPYLNNWNKSRNKHAQMYTKLLNEIPGIKTPNQSKEVFHVNHLYVIECDKRDELQQYLKNIGIETIIHYPIPIHLQKPYLKEGYKKGDFPVTETKSKVILSIPIFPELKKEEINYICSSIKEFMSNTKKK